SPPRHGRSPPDTRSRAARTAARISPARSQHTIAHQTTHPRLRTRRAAQTTQPPRTRRARTHDGEAEGSPANVHEHTFGVKENEKKSRSQHRQVAERRHSRKYDRYQSDSW